MPAISLLLAEGQPLVRDKLRQLLETQEDIVIIGEASCAEDALVQVEANHPQMLLLDVELAKRNNLGVLELVSLASNISRVILMSQYKEEILVREAFKAGAMGFLLKTDPAHKLLRTIRLTAQCEWRKFSLWPPSASPEEQRSYFR